MEAINILKKAIEALQGELVRGQNELITEIEKLGAKKLQIEATEKRIEELNEALKTLEKMNETKSKKTKS